MGNNVIAKFLFDKKNIFIISIIASVWTLIFGPFRGIFYCIKCISEGYNLYPEQLCPIIFTIASAVLFVLSANNLKNNKNTTITAIATVISMVIGFIGDMYVDGSMIVEILIALFFLSSLVSSLEVMKKFVNKLWYLPAVLFTVVKIRGWIGWYYDGINYFYLFLEIAPAIYILAMGIFFKIVPEPKKKKPKKKKEISASQRNAIIGKADKLMNLWELKEKGIITKEEYIEKKKEIL